MSCCRPSAEPPPPSRGQPRRRRALRAVTLIELMTSQAMVLILVAGLITLVVALVRRLHAETSVADAQIHLRQATHMLLRDTQGVGGPVSQAGNLVLVQDGGSNAPDRLTLFKRDESLCNGGLGGIDQQPGNSRVLRVPHVEGACPITSTPGNCSVAELSSRRVVVMGGDRMAIAVPTSPNPQPCQITFGTADNQGTTEEYNRRDGTSFNNIGQVFDDMPPPLQILVGSAYTYRVTGSTLERSIDGSPYHPVLTDVLDFQVERVFDLNGNGTFYAADGGFERDEIVTLSDGAPLPAGATPAHFLGLRLGLLVIGQKLDDMKSTTPATFSNRTLTPVMGRRTRGSFVFAAARNRPGS